MKVLRRHITFIALLLIITLFTLLFIYLGPEGFVELIGVRNSYLLAFIIGASGGVSSITASSFILTIITLVSGGANPFILGIVGGAGITIGDTLFYLLGLKGREALSPAMKKVTNRFSLWIENRPAWVIPIVVIVYATLAPLPNDILTVSLGLCKCNARKIIPPLFIGNILFTTLIALLAVKALI